MSLFKAAQANLPFIDDTLQLMDGSYSLTKASSTCTIFVQNRALLCGLGSYFSLVQPLCLRAN